MNYPIILALNLTKNPQNRGFCAFLASGTHVFRHFEHKIGIFVRFWGLEPLFSGILSTKSRFLCAFAVWNPCFRAFRAQNRHFCVRMGSFSQVFGPSEHKIGISVLGVAPAALSQMTLVQFYRWGDAAAEALNR